MLSRFFSSICFMLLLMTLLAGGCSSKPSPASNLVKVSKQFSERIRWQDFNTAAAFVAADERKDFLANWKESKDLHVVGTHIDAIEMVDAETAEVTMTVDYYILPSATVKQIETRQEWKYREGERFELGSWEMVSGMPMLPATEKASQKDE